MILLNLMINFTIQYFKVLPFLIKLQKFKNFLYLFPKIKVNLNLNVKFNNKIKVLYKFFCNLVILQIVSKK